MSYFVVRKPGETEIQVVTSTVGYDGYDIVTQVSKIPSRFEKILDDGTIELNHEACNKSLHDKIDKEAGEFRKNFITEVPGQQSVYLAKEEEAKAWTPGADPADFPYLMGEATVRGITLEQMAQTILGISDNWRNLSVVIELTRIEAKEGVTNATTIEDKELAANVDWWSLVP